MDDTVDANPRASSVYIFVVEWITSHRKAAAVLGWIAAVVACIARSYQLGVDSNWDLLNYHLYKSTSLFDGSIFSDVAVGGFGTFLNPAIEIPVGLAIELLGVRWGLLIGVALLQLLCYAAFWRLVRAIARVAGGGPRLALTAFVLGVTGSCAVSVSFTTFGDWVVAGLLCEAFRALILSRELTSQRSRAREGLLVGVWAGVAGGIKLTALPLIAGLGVAVLLTIEWKRWWVVAAGATSSFLAVAGPWMLHMEVRYSNPLFPFFGGVFHASAAPERDFDDARFGATSIRTVAEFPAEMLRGSSKYGEYAFQDWRFIAAAALLAAWVCLRPRDLWSDRVLKPLVVTITIAFLLWVTMFGIYRYYLYGELLVSLLIALLVFRLVRDQRWATAVCAMIGVLGLAFQQAPNWGRDVQLSSSELKSAVERLPSAPRFVALSGGPPLSYLLEDFPDSTAATSLWSFAAPDVRYAGEIKQELDALVEDAIAADSFYSISDAGAVTLMPPLETFQLIECQPFSSNDRALQFCRVRAG